MKCLVISRSLEEISNLPHEVATIMSTRKVTFPEVPRSTKLLYSTVVVEKYVHTCHRERSTMEMYTEREIKPPIVVCFKEEGSSLGNASNCLKVESIRL